MTEKHIEFMEALEESPNETVKDFLYALTGGFYSFAFVDKEFALEGKVTFSKSKGKVFQIMPDARTSDDVFFHWYCYVRPKHQYFQTKELCILHFLKYWVDWNRKGKPSIEQEKADAKARHKKERNAKKTDVKRLRESAHDFQISGDFANAITRYQKLIDQKAESYVDYANLGECYFFEGQYQEAITYFKVADDFGFSDISGRIWRFLAHSYMFLGDMMKCLTFHKQSIANLAKDHSDVVLLWETAVKIDFANFNKKGLSNEYFQQVLDTIKAP